MEEAIDARQWAVIRVLKEEATVCTMGEAGGGKVGSPSHSLGSLGVSERTRAPC